MSPKDKKKKKKEKKRKKEKRQKSLDEHVSTTSSSTAVVDASSTVRVSLDANIAALAASENLSWGNVFAAASSIQPEELDQDFLRRTEPTSTDDGLAKMSKLAQEQLSKQQTTEITADEPGRKKQKRRHADDSDGDLSEKETHVQNNAAASGKVSDEDVKSANSDPPVSLEGRMVPHPKQEGVQVMVLVDTVQFKVYSALERTDEGELIPIGSLQSGNVVLDDGAFSSNEDEPPDDAVDNNDPASPASFPFAVEPDDHCESPVESYQDIVMFLKALCQNGKNDKLAIYDPYYCNGAVIRNLASLGFPNVHNQKKDCYKVWSTGVGYPDFQVLVTNPPYSANHIEKLLEHVTCKNFGDRPWLLLMPSWVHKKDYYKRLTANIQPFYLVPKKRYVYLPPKDFRDKKQSDVHKKSSPFVSMWYIWGGTTRMNNQWIDLYHKQQGVANCDLARSRSALRDLRRKGKKR